MIKKEEKSALILSETIQKIKEIKALGLYAYLMANQQEGIYYQTIKEIQKEYNKESINTIRKYINILRKKYHLVEKYKGIYFINYLPQKRI